MAGITTRIWLRHEEGADILCTSNIENLYKIAEVGFEGSYTSYFGNGSKVKLYENEDTYTNYEVIDTYTYIWNAEQTNSDKYGHSMYNWGDRNPYILDIYYILREVKN